MSATTDKITLIGVISNQLFASLEHLKDATNIAINNDMRDLAAELFSIESHLVRIRKDLDRDVDAIRQAELEQIRQGTYKPC